MKVTISTIITLIFMSIHLQAEPVTKDPVCKTTSECDKLTERLQVEIDGLEAKGIENLTDDEFIKLDTLLNQLLAAQKVKTAEEKAKQKAYLGVSKKLDELSGMVK